MRTKLLAIFAALAFVGVSSAQTAPATPQGFINAREFLDINGTVLPDLTNNAKFPNNFDHEGFPSLFEWPTANDPFTPPPSDVKNNYGVQILGWYYPERTGLHTFWIAADDQAALYLSTDANPANMREVAREAQWNGVRSWSATTRRTLVETLPDGTVRYNNVSAPIQLTANQPYYIEARMKEGGGGDNLAVGVSEGPQFEPDQPIPGSRLSTWDRTPGPVTFTLQPQSQTVIQNTPLTLRARVNGTPPYEYQWTRNGEDVLDATNFVYTIDKTPQADNGALYALRVTGGAGVATSQNAVITVTTDAVAPTLTRASGGSSLAEVTLTFSEALDVSNLAANQFSIAGLTVQNAQSVDERTVFLTTSAQTGGTPYTVTVTGVRDLAGNPVASGTTATFTAWIESRGFVQHRFFQGATIATIQDGSALPTMVTFEPRAEWPPNAGTEGGSNYGNELSGWLHPPETGDYIFYLSADDRAELYLSTDASPANAVLVAVEPTWNNPRDWIGLTRRTDPENRTDTFLSTEWPNVNTITLNSNQRYYFRVLHQEGGGGDNVGLNWKLPSQAADPAFGTPPIPGQYISVLSNPDGSSVTITSQPGNITVQENTAGSLSVAATGMTGGSPTTSLNYQWQQATPGGQFTDIAGANSATVAIPPLTLGQTGLRYRVVISVPGASATSSESVITVAADPVPPTIVSVLKAFGANNQIRVRFSEPVASATAVAGNFSVNNGVTVTGAALDPADPSVVVLTTSAIAAGSHTVTVNNVTDLAGNPVAASSSASVGAQRGVLFVVGNATLNGGDAAVRNLLLQRDYNVQVIQAAASTTADATGKDLVITSSTVASGEVTTKFKDVAVPVINWEAALQDDYMMTLDVDGTNRGTTGSQTSIAIINRNHQMAARLNGIVPVSSSSTYSWGTPAGDAQIVASIADNPQRALVYGYAKGAAMLDGFVAPERRVMLFFGDDTSTLLNTNGLKILNAALDWALGIEPRPTRIAFVSFHSSDTQPSSAAATAGFTAPPDKGYVDLLRSQGHEVTRYRTTGTPDIALLNTYDLVIISRSVPSGDYQDPPETLAWNGLTAPTMVLGGYIVRQNRLGLMAGSTIPDTVGDVTLAVAQPTHPIFAGVQLNAGNEVHYAVPVDFNGTVNRGISVVTGDLAGNGVVLATVATPDDPANGGAVIAEWESGDITSVAAQNVLGGDRLLFLTGTREYAGLTSEGAGIFDLTPQGSKMFLNAAAYMSGAPPTSPRARLTISSGANGVTISWTGAGVLQETTSLSSPVWAPSASQANPQTVQPTAARKFFRVLGQ